MFTRRLATASSSSSAKRESSFKRVWLKEYAAWPIIAITAFAATMGTLKIFQAVRGPEYHFNREERRTLDYLENNRDVEQIKDWSKNSIHTPPKFVQERSSYKRHEAE